jgi:hypothetical protein
VFIYDFILEFQIRYLTNTRIIFPPETDSTNENITIVGKKENVNKAKAKFEVMITDIGNVFEEHVEINEKYVGTLVVNRGEIDNTIIDLVSCILTLIVSSLNY